MTTLSRILLRGPSEPGFWRLSPTLKLVFYLPKKVRATHIQSPRQKKKGIKRTAPHSSLKLRKMHLREASQTCKLALCLTAFHTGFSDNFCHRPFQVLNFFHA